MGMKDSLGFKMLMKMRVDGGNIGVGGITSQGFD